MLIPKMRNGGMSRRSVFTGASVLEYSNMKLRELPDKMFTKEYLKKID